MKKFGKCVAVFAAALVLFSGCASTRGADSGEKQKTEKSAKKDKGKNESSFDIEAFNSAYANGDFATCIAMLKERNSDAILNELDSSMLQYLAKDYMASAKEFVQTQQNMQQLSKDMTASKIMEAALVGENSVQYVGNTYERILAYSMKAVNALKMGEVDRAIGVFNEYTGNYKDEIAALVQQQKEIAASSGNITDDEKVSTAIEALGTAGLSVNLGDLSAKSPDSSDAVYDASALLAYLGTLSYLANGDAEHAQDFAGVLESTGSAVNVSEDLNIADGMGRLDVVSLTDVIGKRSEMAEIARIGNIYGIDVTFKLAYPTFEPQNHAINVSKVTLSNGEAKEFTLIEDFDEAVKKDVAQKSSGAFGRSLFRNITKNSAAVAGSVVALQKAQEQVSKASNAVQKKAAEKAYEVAVKGLNVALLAVVDAEKADVRQASFFPNKASAAGFTLEPGRYTVTVEYTNGKTDVIENVNVEAGKPTVVISECMN
jgi:hypothetical protein